MPARKPATKQGTLSFTAGKRTTSAGTKGKASRPSLKRAASSPIEPPTPDVIEIYDSDDHVVADEIESEDDFCPDDEKQGAKRKPAVESISESEEEERVPKRRKLRTTPATRKGVFGSRDGTENIGESHSKAAPPKARARGAKARASLDESSAAAKTLKKGKGELDDLPKDGRWRRHYGAVREKMGNIEPGESHSIFALELDICAVRESRVVVIAAPGTVHSDAVGHGHRMLLDTECLTFNSSR